MIARLVSLLAAVGVVAGGAAAVFPQHVVSVVVVGVSVVAVVVALGSVAAIGVLGDLVPPRETVRREAGSPTPLDPHGLRDARRDLASGRLPIVLRGLVSESAWRAEVGSVGAGVERTAAVHRLLDELERQDREVDR